MSRSINQLLQSLAGNNKPLPLREGELVNPDIPSEKLEIKDQYHKIFKKPSRPRNGTFSLGKDRIFQNQKEEDFSHDGAIDPNAIRNKLDPDAALPDLNSNAMFSFMPDSVRKSRNQVGLIRKSHESELNYRNRFEPRSLGPPSAPPLPSNLSQN